MSHPICATPGCGQLATDIDHKIAVTGAADPTFWDSANHQALCHPCHSRKTCKENGGFGII